MTAAALAHDQSTSPCPAEVADLLRRAGAGDTEAFAALYDLTCQRVYGLVLAVVGCPDRAAAVTRAVYRQAWREAPTGACDGLTRLVLLAHRHALTAGRHRPHPDCGRPSLAVTLAERLSADQAVVLALTYWCGHTLPQTAELLAVPAARVARLLRDALAGLRATELAAP